MTLFLDTLPTSTKEKLKKKVCSIHTACMHVTPLGAYTFNTMIYAIYFPVTKQGNGSVDTETEQWIYWYRNSN